ncbi:MAG: peptidylprolyl isomerase, partial [Moraxellaceae bacterium]
AALAREFSQAESAAKGGDLGWVVHGDTLASWIESIAFVQKPGVVSKPFRSPGPAGGASVWEILLVEERIEGLQPEDSESVRYTAAQAIARRKAVQQYNDTRRRLLQAADVRLAPALKLPARGVEP